MYWGISLNVIYSKLFLNIMYFQIIDFGIQALSFFFYCKSHAFFIYVYVKG